MSTTEPPPGTATASATPSATSSPGSTKLQPVTYVIIPLVTLASVFLVGLFAYLRRRRSRRIEASNGDGDGGEAQMQERRRDNINAADRWPPAGLGFNWWFLRSNEGLNELGEAPPPYDVNKRRKATTEGSAHATDEGAEQENGVHEVEDDEDDESRHSNESIRESARQNAEEARRSSEHMRRSVGAIRGTGQQRDSGQQRRSDETTRETSQSQHTRRSEEQHTMRSEEQPQEATEQIHPPGDTSPTAGHSTQENQVPAPVLEEPTSDGELPLLSGRRRQTPEEIHAIMEARRRRHQRRREREAARAAAAAANPEDRTDICNTEFFRDPSPDRSRRRIERLNRRLRRLGYVTSDTSEYHGFQLRDMEDGVAPPDYEREPEVAVPPPAQLPPPLPADAPPPYPMPIVRRREEERDRVTGPPMVRQTLHEHFPHHNYLFMPPLEHDYMATSFSASLDMPRHLHSRF
ncbi:hypothetical protein LEL_03248 [Akanthomyces lecanii RCEF 1005]|uniref:Uncharacterized protein n=1 Tax=Akanthomyces lecanii RCEF 1005 TaxID=1081108 RepID=A0A162K9Q9_CORDF|nr:hypothetical protein LEL_03248 [Akanthomyces lecanii RCEF 1005]